MLSKKDAQKLLNTISFPGQRTDSSVKVVKLATAPKSLRRTLIQQDGESSEKKMAAAIEVQRIWRGYWARCRVFAITHPRISRQANPTQSRIKLTRFKFAQSPSTSTITERKSPPGYQNGAPPSKLQQHYTRYCENRKKSGKPVDVVSFEDYSANYIQNWWTKMRKNRKRPPTQPLQQPVQSPKSSLKTSTGPGSSAKSVRITGIQPQDSRLSVSSKTSSRQSQRHQQPVKKFPTEPLDSIEAAIIIQRAWRRHIDVQVYRYYRDLINFRNRGDPSVMLRCINPKEAHLLDAASGVHIKFRLAGERFPPNIYYKIFTHRPIQDLCANSPKDYTRPEAKRKAAKDVHNKTGRNAEGRKLGWYERIENNGWRLVSDRLLQRIDQDPVTWNSSHKKQVFHHDKLQRRQDVEKKRKQRKVQWMQKMYHEGMLKARSNDKETISLIEGAAQGMVETIEAEGPLAIDDWEVDELLDWTNALNFDDYVTTWKEVATSANSESVVDQKMKVQTNKYDPYQLTLSADQGTPTVPSPSRATTINSAAGGRPNTTPVTPLAIIQ